MPEAEALRERSEAKGRRGRLKSDVDGNGEEWAPRYFDDAGNLKPEFAALRPPRRLDAYLDRLSDNEKQSVKTGIFAFGGERANATPYTAALNTLFLREHNRIAALIEAAYDFDDEQTFQTARNVTSAILLKLVVEDYINHIAPYHLKLLADPSVAWNATWNKPNWIPIEFNILYRWHGMCPQDYDIAKGVSGHSLLFHNDLMTSIGLGETLDRASRQPAWRLGLFNTADFLQDVELASLQQSREHRLGSYNDYRRAYGYGRVKTFAQISGDKQVQEALAALYESPDKVEFYVGIFAEDVGPKSALPPTIGRMVALDAFSLALTNPLLSEHVWQDDATFTALGREIIVATETLQHILDRNIPAGGSFLAKMSYPDAPE
jgi:prostaglandin-endoperoxide synthase 2